MPDHSDHTLKSAEKLFNILEQVLELNGARLKEIADETALNKSTVHVHLQTLVKRGYVVQDGPTYEPSLSFLWHGERVREGNPIYRHGRAEVGDLAEETNELTNLATREQGKVVLLHIAEGENAVHDHTPGKRLPMHSAATGKAILAHLPTDEVDGIIDEHGLPPVTENTITDRDALGDALADVRKQGYAVDDEEGGSGIRCVAAPITPEDRAIGAVSITGPAKRIAGEYQSSLQEAVMNTANVIEVKLRYS